jgi:hypothetical protein
MGDFYLLAKLYGTSGHAFPIDRAEKGVNEGQV